MTRVLSAVGLAALACLSAALGCGSDVKLLGAGGGPGDGGAGGSASGCTSSSECAVFDEQCSIGQCVGGVCTSSPTNELGACNDGILCTTGDTCIGGVCAGSQVICATTDPCLVGYCLAESGQCAVAPANDGAACEDGDPCTAASSCNGGACAGGAPTDCSFFDGQCTAGACGPVGCFQVPINQGIPCEDDLFCTTGATCNDGSCGGGQVTPCADPGQCLIGVCDEATDQCLVVPGEQGSACDDQDPCTVASTCAAGQCVGGVPGNEGQPCDDQNICTVNDACVAGACLGASNVTTYFSDTFASNTQGWLLGPEWGIGSATASVGGTFGADPDTDHSPGADNGVAGVVLGGNASVDLHPFYYLESPAIDTSAPGPVLLSFWRWLNSDYLPFMQNQIEVWNGAAWIPIWMSGDPPQVQDSPPEGPGWNQHVHDLTALKNPAMKVRFGFNVASQGAFTIGSWNIDDVRIGSAVCD